MRDRPLLEGAPEPGSPGDTLADKLVRFGIGAGLASLVLVSLVLAGVGEGVGLAPVLGICFIGVALAGSFSVTHGERFVERLGRLVRWMA